MFRTNQSYDRWWEARKIWGTILNRTRDITAQVRQLSNIFQYLLLPELVLGKGAPDAFCE